MARSSVDFPEPEPPITATIFAELDLKRHAAERMHAVRISFADAFEHEHGYIFSWRMIFSENRYPLFGIMR